MKAWLALFAGTLAVISWLGVSAVLLAGGLWYVAIPTFAAGMATILWAVTQ